MHREKIEGWRIEYYERRPHSSLGDRTPEEFAKSAMLQGRKIHYLAGTV